MQGKEVVRVKGTNGSYREKVSPWVDLQRTAWQEVCRMGAEFGLSPASGYSLMRDQAAVASRGSGDLFADKSSAAAPQPEAAAPVEQPNDMTAFDSAPPGARPN